MGILFSGSEILLVNKVFFLINLYYYKINIGHVVKYNTWSIDS